MARSGWSRARVFFALTFLISWTAWIAAVLSGMDYGEVPTLVLVGVGGVGPAVAALVLLYCTGDRAQRRDYWQRTLDLRRISPRWYAVIFGFVPMLYAVAALLNAIVGGDLSDVGVEDAFQQEPLSILSLAVFTLAFGPIPEEMGWRGYALDRLQARFRAVTASLVLGVAWALWHLPLFFIPGSYQHNLGAGSLMFGLYLFDLLPKSIIYTWIYNNTRRSTLSAILFHFMVNFTGQVLNTVEAVEYFLVILWTFAAVAVTAVWGSGTLARLARR